MAKQLFSNNANTTVDAQLLIAGTSLMVASGTGALFSSPSTDQYELITLYASDSDYEVVKCTSRSGDVLTIVRGHEGTARQWEVGELVSARVTRDTLEVLRDNPAKGEDFYEHTFLTTENSYALNIEDGRTQRLLLHDTNVSLTISSTGLTSGRAYWLTLIVKKHASHGSVEITFPTLESFHPNGTSPTQTAMGGAEDVYRILTLDAGSNFYVFPMGADMDDTY